MSKRNRNRNKVVVGNVSTLSTTIQPPKQQASGLLPSLYDYRNMGKFRFPLYRLQSNEKAIDKTSREEIVKLSRILFSQFPIFNVASEFKANWVVGDHWDLKYMGGNSDWGNKAQEWFNNVWSNRCSNRGFNYDFKTMIKLMSTTIDIDGDLLVLLTKDDSNWPLLQVITTDRVTDKPVSSNQITLNNVVYTYSDGILFDSAGTPQFYAVKESDDSYKYVSVRDAKIIFNPQFFDKHRGLPALYSGTLYGLNLQELDTYTMEALKLESVVAVQETNDNGEAPQEFADLLSQASNDNTFGGANLQTAAAGGLEMIQGASNRYLKSGNTMQSFRSQRPSEEIQSYMTKIETALLTSIGYPHQLLYSPDKISGRSVNAITEFVRKSVRARQSLLYKHVKLFAAWALSVAIQNGDLPKTNENIFNVIDFTMPEQYTLDKRYDRQSDNEDYKLGVMTLGEIIEKNGGNYQKTTVDRKNETIQLLQSVEDIAKQYPEVSKEVILSLLSQRGNSSLTISPTANNTPEEL